MATHNSIKVISAIFLLSLCYSRTSADGSTNQPLTDGLALTSVEGRLIQASDGNRLDRWFFEFDSDVNESRGYIKAGTSLEVLPSATLEKMTSQHRPSTSYKLWGKITRYGIKNFIFPVYALTLGKSEPQPVPDHVDSNRQQQKNPAVIINDPNDVLTVPKEIMDKLRIRRIIQPEQLQKGLELKQDSVLVDRTAVLVEKTVGFSEFVLDSVGRNVGRILFRVLPCETLERAQQQQKTFPEKLRFTIAGIITKYKGDYYLLPERATRVYSYGNFGN